MDKFVVGTLVKSEIEADPRDFKIAAVLEKPTEEQLKNLPLNFSRKKNIGKTSYQNGRGSCTALGGTHNMQILNIEELVESLPQRKDEIYTRLGSGDNIINLSREDLWTKMGHVLGDKKDSGDYVENMIKALNKKGIAGVAIDGSKKEYYADGFAFMSLGTAINDILQLKYQLTKSPLVFVIKGNSKTRSEMQKGRITTVLEASDFTGAHCIALEGFSIIGLHFLNSWVANNGTKRICSFIIDYKTYNEMCKTGMVNWRCWRIFDKKDAVIDLEFEKRKQEAMQTVRQLKKSYEKGTIEDKNFIEKSGIGNYLRKTYGFTDNDL